MSSEIHLPFHVFRSSHYLLCLFVSLIDSISCACTGLDHDVVIVESILSLALSPYSSTRFNLLFFLILSLIHDYDDDDDDQERKTDGICLGQGLLMIKLRLCPSTLAFSFLFWLYSFLFSFYISLFLYIYNNNELKLVCADASKKKEGNTFRLVSHVIHVSVG